MQRQVIKKACFHTRDDSPTAMFLASVPWPHRTGVRSAMDALLTLQGETCQPAETKVVVHTNGAYELQAIKYPLGVTSEQLKRLPRQSPYITAVYVDFSVQGSTGRGAVCVLVNASARRKERVDEEDAIDAVPVEKRKDGYVRVEGTRRRTEKTEDDTAAAEPSWISRLWKRVV